MNVYFISGLGTDKRVFKKLHLSPSFTIHHIEWIPFENGESLGHYAKRLSELIDTTQPFSLVGLSLGGMVVSEMCTFLQPQKAIIISSAATAKELPPYFTVAGKLNLNKLVPTRFYQWPSQLAYWFFGIKTDEEKALFKSILKDADYHFVRRAINAVMHWHLKEKPKGLVHIHGAIDKLLPLQFAHADVVVKGGGHLMVFSMADEISVLLEKELSG